MYFSNYQSILKKIASTHPSNRHPYHSKTLIAVSKLQSLEKIKTLYQLGQRDFGENYAQELIQKATHLRQEGFFDIRWHFLGHLQSNKVKPLIPFIHMIHSIESETQCFELTKHWVSASHPDPFPVFIEVNLDNELHKSGIAATDIPDFLKIIQNYPALSVQGLMALPAPHQDPRARFIQLRELEITCRPTSCGMLSMGMSDDYEIALQEGATHIRIGTALFGPRSDRAIQK